MGILASHISVGYETGCWRVLGLNHRCRKNNVRYLNIICLKCGFKFVRQAPSLKRKKTIPKNCEHCRNMINLKKRRIYEFS